MNGFPLPLKHIFFRRICPPTIPVLYTAALFLHSSHCDAMNKVLLQPWINAQNRNR